MLFILCGSCLCLIIRLMFLGGWCGECGILFGNRKILLVWIGMLCIVLFFCIFSIILFLSW